MSRNPASRFPHLPIVDTVGLHHIEQLLLARRLPALLPCSSVSSVMTSVVSAVSATSVA